jgi:hypothetical protein
MSSGRQAVLLVLAALWPAVLAAAPAASFELLDDRLQVHGFYEMQLRTLSADYSEQWDVAQWYHVLDVELELDILPDPIGPIDLVGAFVRLEGRYDCVYSRGCGLFRGIDAYGDRARRLPPRLNDADEADAAGVIPLPERREPLEGPHRDPVPLMGVRGIKTLFEVSEGPDEVTGVPSRSGECFSLWGAACEHLAGADDLQDGRIELRDESGGVIEVLEVPAELAATDDPVPVSLGRFGDFRFTQLQKRGGAFDGADVRIMGPWLPRNEVTPIASLADVPNPLDGTRTNAQLQASVYNAVIVSRMENYLKNHPGETAADIPRSEVNTAVRLAVQRSGFAEAVYAGALPFRPIPVADEGRPGTADGTPRGLYIPSTGLRRTLARGSLDSFDFNFSETERAFNHGASQQQTKELKEAYLDVEWLEGRLWTRIGKQNIVWGKTELFSATDQFNPQDLALASLPSFEESRIPLWAVRAVYSLFDVGPLSDVRLELAVNYDEFEPDDLGACGEAYTPNAVCELTFGAFAHGITGAGVIGVDRPEDPWHGLEGWEVGGRVEWRWDRFSFAISDFWGYDDLPVPVQVVRYERNVDPSTGRPRVYGARGPCASPDLSDPDCLRPGPTHREGGGDDSALATAANNALLHHHANQQVHAFVCSSTIGIVAEEDASACATSTFNSQEVPTGSFAISQIISGILSGGLMAASALTLETGLGTPVPPVVQLSMDPMDASNAGSGCTDSRWVDNPLRERDTMAATCGGDPFTLFGDQPEPESLALRLAPEQEALLGCGPYWGTNCDVSGIDLMNAEASALLQSWPGIEGTGPGWRPDDPSRPQPGTLGFAGGPRCTTADIGGPADPSVMLPGCRGPGDPGYDVARDGDPSGTRTRLDLRPLGFSAAGLPVHPFTGQRWQNEMAALSWNFLVLVVQGDDEFDGSDVYSLERCSFLRPELCQNVREFFTLAGVQRNTLRAGGNGRFGRRTFQWHGGGAAVLRYPKRNVLGFAVDFAEDWSKTNWSLEATWVDDVPARDNDSPSGLSDVDEYNLTISVDRSTFINFLNPNRTFFFNTQWFIQHQDGAGRAFPMADSWNVLATFTVQSGYFQDRLNPSLTFVYDFQSASGAALPQVSYRYSASFSVTVGASLFFGRSETVDMPLSPLAPPQNRLGPDAYRDETEKGLSPIRDRDEVFLLLRYAF